MDYQIIEGDCIEGMRRLEGQSVNCVVTSPPYFGLRDYGHDGQIGLEASPDAYVSKLVEVFREVRRVLRDDGTVWLNLGDSYAGSGRGSGCNTRKQTTNRGSQFSSELEGAVPYGMKPKDLIGIPWMLAFALRADGWYLRQDIIWAKPNPMPESVKDRCTKSHEYIFLLSKSAKYYYDNEAVKEPVSPNSEYDRKIKATEPCPYDKALGRKQMLGHGSVGTPDGRNKRDVWTVTTKPYKGAHYATFNPELIKPCILAGAPEGGIVFDPFVGSGTTVATAIQLGRKGIGIDLSFKYLQENAKARVESAELPLLNFIEQ